MLNMAMPIYCSNESIFVAFGNLTFKAQFIQISEQIKALPTVKKKKKTHSNNKYAYVTTLFINLNSVIKFVFLNKSNSNFGQFMNQDFTKF